MVFLEKKIQNYNTDYRPISVSPTIKSTKHFTNRKLPYDAHIFILFFKKNKQDSPKKLIR